MQTLLHLFDRYRAFQALKARLTILATPECCFFSEVTQTSLQTHIISEQNHNRV